MRLKLIAIILAILILGCNVLTDVTVHQGMYGDDCQRVGNQIVCEGD